MATTSAGALESLRHSIYFSWHGRLLESDAPLRSKDGTSGSLGWGWAAYVVVALPLGFLTGFLTWRPDVDVAGLMAMPVIIYMTTALPEEFLFRGVIQNLLTRCWKPRVGLWVAAIVFGLAHLPDLRYVLLATLAGLGYGWVYARTGKITASALTHTGVNWIWKLLLSYP